MGQNTDRRGTKQLQQQYQVSYCCLQYTELTLAPLISRYDRRRLISRSKGPSYAHGSMKGYGLSSCELTHVGDCCPAGAIV